QEITGDRDEVRAPFPRPDGRLPCRADARRGDAEVEVREVRDPEAVQLLRQPGQLDVEHTPPQPTGLEQAPPQTSTGQPGRNRRADAFQTSSRSSAGRGSTMWRLNFSSASSSPAATPTSCARWRIG